MTISEIVLQLKRGDLDCELDESLQSFVQPMPEDWRGFACGGAADFDTSKALYRALFLFKPSNIDFSDMYKTHLFGVVSLDGRFAVWIELFKYELGLYFYCRDKSDIEGQSHFVQSGYPDSDNGIRCSSQEGKDFSR